jgi:hypothetical protein
MSENRPSTHRHPAAVYAKLATCNFQPATTLCYRLASGIALRPTNAAKINTAYPAMESNP